MATFDVFAPPAGMHGAFDLGTDNGLIAVHDSDRSGSFRALILLDENGDPIGTGSIGGFLREGAANSPDGTAPLFIVGPSSSNNRPAAAGELLVLNTEFTEIPAVPNITLRIYTRASDGMLALTPHLTAGIADTCADGLTSDQFFLDEDWAETKTANANNQGHTAPDCASANRIAGDDLMCGGCLSTHPFENSAGMCEMIMVPSCGVDMRLDAAANECVACDAGMVSGASEQTCRMPMSDAECMRADAMTPMWDGNMCVAAATPMPDPTPPNCTGNNRINDAGDGCIPCGDGMRPTSDRMMCEAIPPTPAPSPTPAPTPQPTPPAASQAAEDADWATAGGLVGGIMGLVFVVHYLGGEADAFSFNPDFGYAISESGYSYKYGGRVDFRKDAWSLYMSAGQRNADGDWGDLRYKSGGEYDGGFWRASFSESVAGDTTDYDFSLSADWNGGIWRVSPTYRFRSQLTKGGLESESKNALNLEAALEYNRWTLRPSAGFRWRRADDFGDNAKFAITAVRRF